MARATIADVARTAEVSVSTVDRVLNGRYPVRPATAEKVLSAAEKLGFYATGLIRQRLCADKPSRTFGFLLQQRSRTFYQLLGTALTDATKASTEIRGEAVVDFVDDLTPGVVAKRLTKLGRETDAIAVVAADHPHITQAVDQLKNDGVPVFALISNLTAQNRAGYVGIDNWKVGRTAAWAVASICGAPGKVGVFVGSHRYLCQDICESSFRSYFRQHAPDFQILEPLTTMEDGNFAYENTLDLIGRYPDLVGLYVAGGGVRGVMRALRELGPETYGRIVTVGQELTDETRAGLLDGVLKLVISHPLKALATTTIDAMIRSLENEVVSGMTSQHMLPIDVYTPENV